MQDIVALRQALLETIETGDPTPWWDEYEFLATTDYHVALGLVNPDLRETADRIVVEPLREANDRRVEEMGDPEGYSDSIVGQMSWVSDRLQSIWPHARPGRSDLPPIESPILISVISSEAAEVEIAEAAKEAGLEMQRLRTVSMPVDGGGYPILVWEVRPSDAWPWMPLWQPVNPEVNITGPPSPEDPRAEMGTLDHKPTEVHKASRR
jgi:hypothetical protein